MGDEHIRFAQCEPESTDTLSRSVLLLNKHYMALKVISARRAFLFLAKDYAQVIHKNNGRFEEYRFNKWIQESNTNDGRSPDEYIHTPKLKILIPMVIRLLEYGKMPRRDWAFNRKNILIRDNYQCQYCGKKEPVNLFTIDHIKPRSRGGTTTWTNAVTCCHKCNTKKGGRLPSEAGMTLLSKPQVPKFNYNLYWLLKDKKYALWKEFIPSSTQMDEKPSAPL